MTSSAPKKSLQALDFQTLSKIFVSSKNTELALTCKAFFDVAHNIKNQVDFIVDTLAFSETTNNITIPEFFKRFPKLLKEELVIALLSHPAKNKYDIIKDLSEIASKANWFVFFKKAIPLHKLVLADSSEERKELYHIEPLIDIKALSINIDIESFEGLLERVSLYLSANKIVTDAKKEYRLSPNQMVNNETLVHIHKQVDVYHDFGNVIARAIRKAQTALVENIFKLEKPTISKSWAFYYTAISSRSLEMLNVVVEYLNLAPMDFNGILMQAVVVGQAQMVSILLKQKPEGFCFNSSLLLASRVSSVEVVELLVSNGANIYFENFRSSPIQAAILKGNSEIAKYYLEKGVKLSDVSKDTILRGLRNADLAFTKTLFENDLLAILSPKEVTLALCMADSPKALIYLSKNGVNLDSYHKEILETTFKNSLDSILSFLLKKDLNIDKIPTDLLKTGFEVGNMGFIKTLLSNGVDIHFENEYPLFALCNFISRYRKGPYCLEYVIKGGADIYANNSAALNTAIGSGYTKHAKIIFKSSKKKHKGLEEGILKAFLSQKSLHIKEIVKNRNVINIKASEVFYKLCLGPKRGKYISFIQQFLKFKVNVNYKRALLINALVIENTKQSTEVLKFLIDHGIKIDTKIEDTLLNAIKFENMVVIGRMVELGISDKKVLESGLRAAKKNRKTKIYNLLKTHQLNKK